ncbi:putative phage abortive infection protein [Chryseobacterium nepalense]|uniref:putative phage abortive infection protein n=1 Tax=Chryseobacterium nepalense TaxID=1854498 RepID=UPI002DFA8268|nr:hypothetical protein [Chryseobacterium nepalense]
MTKNNFFFKYFISTLSIIIIVYFSIYIYNYYSTNDILLHIPDSKFNNDQNEKVILKPNEIGDSIGGILNPLIGLVAAIFTFLAFLMQVFANDEIKKQFTQDKFENRIFKLMDIYNENISRFSFRSKQSGRIFTNKSSFPILYGHFNTLIEDVNRFNNSNKISFEEKITNDYKENLLSRNKSSNLNNWVKLEFCYVLFFYGVGKKGRENIKAIFRNKYDSEYVNNVINYLSYKPAYMAHDYIYLQNWNKIFPEFENFSEPCLERFDRYYEGVQNNFGHYYRNLFAMINYLNKGKDFKYSEKWDFAKFFRSQMSNHEQIFFFLNSISILGRAWELNVLVENNLKVENERLITKYDLIKNISVAERELLEVEKFYPNVEYEYGFPTLYRKKLNKKIYK